MENRSERVLPLIFIVFFYFIGYYMLARLPLHLILISYFTAVTGMGGSYIIYHHLVENQFSHDWRRRIIGISVSFIAASRHWTTNVFVIYYSTCGHSCNISPST